MDTFTEDDLRGAMKSEIDTLGICSKFFRASKINLFFLRFIYYFRPFWIRKLYKKMKDIGKKNESGFTIDECYEERE